MKESENMKEKFKSIAYSRAKRFPDPKTNNK